MIPVEAVEAATLKLASLNSDAGDQLTDAEWAREILEAAAPHIRARALDDAKDALNPGGSYVLQNIAKWLSERAATERTTQ